MASTKTLAEIRTQVRQRADQENSKFISDSELLSYINASYAELYDILVSAFADYYISSETFTLSGTNLRALPSDFYKLRGVDYQISNGEWITLYKFNFERRNSKNREIIRTYRGEPTRQYRLQGSNLRIEPENQADGTYRIWYVPNFTALSADTDTVDGVNGWEEYIVVDAAIKCAIKDEMTDYTGLMAQKAALSKRIHDMAAERDAGEPEVIGDVQTDLFYFDEDFPYLR